MFRSVFDVTENFQLESASYEFRVFGGYKFIKHIIHFVAI